MPNWTREQRQAIDARNPTLLVSAAAGSGKTAVLVERIVELVREGARLHRMLIVTFTHAAAGEMRQRLSARLLKEARSEPELFGQALDDLESADISTIHAFCQRVLKSDFQAVGVDPMARVCDEQLRAALFEQAFRDAMNELLEESGVGDFRQLETDFDQRALREMTETLYRFLMAMPDPFEWLDRQIARADQGPLRAHPWYQALVDETRAQLQGLAAYVDAEQQMLSLPEAVPALEETARRDAETVSALLDLADRGDAPLLEALQSCAFVKAAACRKLDEGQKAWKERFAEVRKKMKGIVSDGVERLSVQEEPALVELAVIARDLRGLSTLVKRVHHHFSLLKNERNVIDFGDMEQLTLAILRRDDLRRAYVSQYDHIFVDECQDVSAVQDAILQSIHGPGNCLFMVGDVKQSIYRFRLADPTLFLGRVRGFSSSEEADERRIFLQKNFRSSRAVLDAANRVFCRAMRRDATELDYTPEDALIPGRETSCNPPVEIRLVRRKEEGGSSEACLMAEARLIARRIRELLQTTFDDGGVPRAYQYRDMVILLQKRAGVGARLSEMLGDMGIPVYFDGADNYFGLPEIRAMHALLCVCDNPMQDVPLLTALKHPPFQLTDGELTDIRLEKEGRGVPFYEAFSAACDAPGPLGDKCRRARDRLAEYRFLRDAMPLSDFVWYLERETGFYALCGAYPEGELRQANLRLLCQKAAEYESNGGADLSGFLRQIDLQMQQPDSTGAKTLGENENLVRVMTMHKSKGLEFPVVFLMRLTAPMAGQDAGVLRLHPKLGACLPYVNRALSIRRPSFAEEAFRGRKRLDERAERCRLLYVAMTRARDYLILTGCAEEEHLNWRLPDGTFRASSAACMMDWVMQAVCDEEGRDDLPWRMTYEEEPTEEEPLRQPRAESEMGEWLRHVLAVAASGEGLPWVGREVRAISAPLKTSVSSLVRRAVLGDPMPLSGEEEEAADKREPEEIVAPLRLSEIPSRPAFLEEKRITGAERGTLTHKFLCLAPLERLRNVHGSELRDEIRRAAGEMAERGCFVRQELDVVDLSAIAAFFEGDLGARMLRAEEIRREQPFNLRLPGGTLLQGVIDCAFVEDGAWVVADYKTDRVLDESAFVARYSAQLNWYREALERLSGRSVREMWLYAIGLGRAFPVPRQAMLDEHCST